MFDWFKEFLTKIFIPNRYCSKCKMTFATTKGRNYHETVVHGKKDKTNGN